MTIQRSLPSRQGAKPNTTNSIPHAQLDQHGSDDIVDKLHEWAFALPDVENQHSKVSVPGARALVIQDSCDCNANAFMIGREFAHIHPHPDNGSMHLMLTPEDAEYIIEEGWGEDHFLVTLGHFPKGLVMVFSPRTDEELETIKEILRWSYEFANDKHEAH